MPSLLLPPLPSVHFLRVLRLRNPLRDLLHTSLRTFTLTAPTFAKPLPQRLTIPETDIEESFLKGSGPGGQKINKTSSAVQLKHIPTGLVVKSQETRSRTQNRKIARRVLAEKIEEMEMGEGSRKAIKAEVARRKKASKAKKAKRKYRKLEEAKAAGAVAEEEDGEGDEEEVKEESEDEVGDKVGLDGVAGDYKKGG